MKRLLVAAAFAALASPAWAETATSPLGVAVEVPEGYTWKTGFKFKPSTVIYLEGSGKDRPAIVVNAIKLTEVMPEAGSTRIASASPPPR